MDKTNCLIQLFVCCALYGPFVHCDLLIGAILELLSIQSNWHCASRMVDSTTTSNLTL